MAKFTMTSENAMRQRINAAELMQKYTEFAKRIGCVVEGEEIQCTAKQSKLLKEWWEKQ